MWRNGEQQDARPFQPETAALECLVDLTSYRSRSVLVKEHLRRAHSEHSLTAGSARAHLLALVAALQLLAQRHRAVAGHDRYVLRCSRGHGMRRWSVRIRRGVCSHCWRPRRRPWCERMNLRVAGSDQRRSRYRGAVEQDGSRRQRQSWNRRGRLLTGCRPRH
jgi:hypothetical protein